MDPGALRKRLVFVVANNGAIDIYRQGGKNQLVGEITSDPYPTSIAADTAGNIYSQNSSFSSTNVTVYAPPYTKGPKLTLTGRTFFGPIAVSRPGTIAVFGCTIPSGSQCGTGFLFYAVGSTTPCATVLVDETGSSPFSNGIWGAAFDHKGNLYFGSGGSGTEAPLAVGRINGSCNAKNFETFTTNNAIAYAGDVRFNKAGRIAILVATGTTSYTVSIDTYDPPKNGSLGDPVSTTTLPGGLSAYSGSFAFQSSGRNFWAGQEPVEPSYDGGVSEFSYPAGGAPKKVIAAPLLYAGEVAVTPALVP
ncbi:MAG TPA: hypothetical protein VGI19_08570 [Candidatus Cybelea sp.]|jgi:hypothetical protein